MKRSRPRKRAVSGGGLLGREGLEVRGVDPAAAGLEAGGEPRGGLALVELARAVRRERAERAAERGLAQGVVLDVEQRRHVRVLGQRDGERARDREPVLGRLDRGGERVGPRAGGAERVQRAPARDGAGDRDRIRAGHGHPAAAGALLGGAHPAGGRPARVDRHGVAAGTAHDGEQVAAGAAVVRVRDRERGRRRQRRVDRVPARRERGLAGRGRAALRAGDGEPAGHGATLAARRAHGRSVSRKVAIRSFWITSRNPRETRPPR